MSKPKISSNIMIAKDSYYIRKRHDSKATSKKSKLAKNS